jgi:hypothetical protein
MDETSLRARLEGCLLDPDELAGGPEGWARLDDPFPFWSRGAAA